MKLSILALAATVLAAFPSSSAEDEFAGTYHGFPYDSPLYDLTVTSNPTEYQLRQGDEGTTTKITFKGNSTGDYYQLLSVVREEKTLPFGQNKEVPAVGLADGTIIVEQGVTGVSGTKSSLDGSIEFATGTRLVPTSPCVCATADYSDSIVLTDDLSIEYKAFLDIDPEKSFVCSRLVRQGKGWIGFGINPGPPENPNNPPKNAMQGGEAVIGTLKDGDQPQAVLKYHLNGETPRVALFPPERQTLICPSITYDEFSDETTMTFGKYLKEEGEYEIKVAEDNTFLFAYGSLQLGYHRDGRGVVRVDLSTLGTGLVDYEVICQGGVDNPPREGCPNCPDAKICPDDQPPKGQNN